MLSKIITFILAIAFAIQQPAFASAYGALQSEPSLKATYVCATPPFATVASATDMWQIFGSSSKTIRILKITCSYYSGAASLAPNYFYLVKRSSANSSGTTTTPTVLPLDSNDASASAVVKYYASGSNPTTGTAVANVSMLASLGINPSNVPQPAVPIILFDADKYGHALVLRGVAEGVVINNNGVTLPGSSPTLMVTVTWTEE